MLVCPLDLYNGLFRQGRKLCHYLDVLQLLRQLHSKTRPQERHSLLLVQNRSRRKAKFRIYEIRCLPPIALNEVILCLVGTVRSFIVSRRIAILYVKNLNCYPNLISIVQQHYLNFNLKPRRYFTTSFEHYQSLTPKLRIHCFKVGPVNSSMYLYFSKC